MGAIVKELTIAADTERVWNALTQPEEIGYNYVSFSPQKGEVEEKDASHV